MTESSSITTTRLPFPEKFAKQVKSQFMQFAHTDMSAFTVDKTKSQFYGARTDLTVYTAEGKVVLMGRDFGDRTFFWQP